MHMFVTKSHNKCDILYMIFYVYIIILLNIFLIFIIIYHKICFAFLV